MIATRAAVLPVAGYRLHVVLLAAEGLVPAAAAEMLPLGHGTFAMVTTRHRADVPEQLLR